MNNAQKQLNRMKVMMTYGLQTEGKKNDFASLEYNRLGADGKMYGIVREGTKYYIKVSNDTKNLIKENFEYIGGFRNRKSNEYTSYANALKHFDLNMRSINEAVGKKNGKTFIAESWNPERQEFVMVEATQKMHDEIARQRQIMSNAAIIFEGKDGSCCCGDCCGDNCQKGNGKQESAKKGNYTMGTGNAETAKGVGFDEDAPKKPEDMPNLYDQVKTNVKAEGRRVKGKRINEGDNGTLAWHKTGGDAQETIADTYLDTSHGTKIGKGSPFDGCPKGDAKREMKNGTVEEGTSMAMDCGDNQNNPTPGVNKIGNGAPFGKKTKKSVEEGCCEGDNLPSAPKQVNNLADDSANDEEGWRRDYFQEAEDGEPTMDDDPMGGEDADPMGGEDADPMGGEDADPMGGEDADPMGGEDADPMGGAPEDDDMDMDDDMPSDDMDMDDDMDLEGDDMDDDAELEDSDETSEIESLRSELDSLKDLIASVAEKIGVPSADIADDEFSDDSLYPDDDEDFEDEDMSDEDFEDDDFSDEMGDEDLDMGDEDFEDEDMSDEDFEGDDEDFEDEDDDTQVFESRSYRRMKRLNEDRLDYFGKHPAYRKVPMQLPTTGEDQNAHGRDWNDQSVHTESPYGEKIGSGAPFEVDPEEITNTIAESIQRYLGKGRRR